MEKGTRSHAQVVIGSKYRYRNTFESDVCKTSIAVEQATEVKLLFLFLLKGSSESEKEGKKGKYMYIVTCVTLS